MQFLLQQSVLLKSKGTFPKERGDKPGDVAHGRAPPTNPSPTTLALSHAAAPFEPPTQHHRSQPRCRDAGGVTSKGQEIILCQSREGRAPGDISQQLGRGFIASRHEGFHTRRIMNPYLGHRSTLAFLRVNLSISL